MAPIPRFTAAQLTLVTNCFLAAGLIAQAPGNQNVPLNNWPAPQVYPGTTAIRDQSPHAHSDSLVFIAITPCRVVDTRSGSGFAGSFGSPSLIANATRTFPIQLSACSIPEFAQAYSFNVTVIPPGPLGYLTMWPTGQPQPNAVTLDDVSGDLRNNAAIVPAGSPNGSVDVHVNAATDLVVDINGYYAQTSGTTSVNVSLGASALAANTSGVFNVATGFQALAGNTTGSYNAAHGTQALAANTTGNENTGVGNDALYVSTSGLRNVAVGSSALFYSTGSFNSAFGYGAGVRLQSGDNNLYLGNPGMNTETNTIRVGTGNADIAAAHTRFFTAAVRGITTGVGDAVNVMIDSHGQLGTINSSRRFKEEIQDMGEASSGLLRLRPVTYRYQQPYADGSKPLDYGLIAEEVAEVFPDLVPKSLDGQAETVQYHKLIPMLLNELQRLQARVETLEKNRGQE